MNFTNTDSKKLACDGSFLFQMRGIKEKVFWQVYHQFNSIRCLYQIKHKLEK